MYHIIKDIILEENPNAEIIDSYDYALIGFGRKQGNVNIAVYNIDKCIEIIKENNKISYMEAYSRFKKTLEKGYIDENSPIFINDFRKLKEISNDTDDLNLNRI